MADGRGFDLDHLQAAVTSGDFLATEGGGLGPRWAFRAAALVGYASAPLWAEAGAARIALVEARSTVDVTAALSLGAGVTAGVDLPLVVAQSGAAFDGRSGVDGAGGGGGAALGDLRLVLGAALPVGRGVSVGSVASLRLPTGARDAFAGEGGVVVEPRLVVSAERGRVRAALNLGLRLRGERRYLDLTVGDELTGSAALALAATRVVEAFAELHADTALSSRAFDRAATPVEALVGAGAHRGGFGVRLAAAIGVVGGYGDPGWRLLASVGYDTPRPAPTPPPPSGAIVARPRAGAPRAPASPPPPPPPPEPRLAAVSSAARTPQEIDGASVDPAEPSVAISRDFVELAQPIFFDTNRAHIHHRFYAELVELARALAKRPWIRTLWVQGHTDDTGPRRWNQELSSLRAARVTAFLEAAGVPGVRLRALAEGDRKPWFSNAQESGRARNRRVMFLIER